MWKKVNDWLCAEFDWGGPSSAWGIPSIPSHLELSFIFLMPAPGLYVQNGAPHLWCGFLYAFQRGARYATLLFGQSSKWAHLANAGYWLGTPRRYSTYSTYPWHMFSWHMALGKEEDRMREWTDTLSNVMVVCCLFSPLAPHLIVLYLSQPDSLPDSEI